MRYSEEYHVSLSPPPGKRPDAFRPRPIMAKFEHYKQEELVRSRGKELRETDYSVNDQFPKEILERLRVLFPIQKKFMEGGSRTVIAVDKLLVNGQLLGNFIHTRG